MITVGKAVSSVPVDDNELVPSVALADDGLAGADLHPGQRAQHQVSLGRGQLGEQEMALH